MRWSVLIGWSAGALGLLSAFTVGLTYLSPANEPPLIGDWFDGGIGLAMLLLSYPLCAAREWARRVLIGILVLSAVGTACLVLVTFVTQHWAYARIQMSVWAITHAAIIATAILVLAHRDVRREFNAQHVAT
jgi:hypothetical protein